MEAVGAKHLDGLNNKAIRKGKRTRLESRVMTDTISTSVQVYSSSSTYRLLELGLELGLKLKLCCQAPLVLGCWRISLMMR